MDVNSDRTSATDKSEGGKMVSAFYILHQVKILNSKLEDIRKMYYGQYYKRGKFVIHIKVEKISKTGQSKPLIT